MPQPKLAIVQHGDYRAALEILKSDGVEPYFGMKRCVRFIEDYLKDVEHCLVSVDAMAYTQSRPGGKLIGLSRPTYRKLGRFVWGYRVYKHIKEFKPTHLLLRTGGALAYPSLSWAIHNHAQSLVLMAGYWNSNSFLDRFVNRLMVKALNDPSVYRATNHRRPATLSMLRAGVQAEKVLAWDFDGLPSPANFPVKELTESGPTRLLFVGELKEGKGITDLLEAYKLLLLDHQRNVELRVCGSGSLKAELEEFVRSNRLTGVEFLGQVANDRVQRFMRESTLICVLSRSDSSEGFPFVMTEALASRTPVIATEHPAIVELLGDGDGICLVPSRSPVAIAEAVTRLSADPSEYRRLSNATSDAHKKISCDITFEQLLAQWREAWI